VGSRISQTVAGAYRPSASLRNVGATAWWALGLTWHTSRALTIGIVGTTLGRSVLPVALALTLRSLVNAGVGALGSGQGFAAVWVWSAIGCALGIAHALASLAARFFARRLRDELNLNITLAILTHANDLDVAVFQDPGVSDVVDRAQHNAAGHFAQFVTSGLAAFTNVLQAGSLVLLLVAIEPLVAPALIIMGVPYLWFHLRTSRLQYSSEHSRATARRWTRYFLTRLTQPDSLAEVKLLGLGPLLVDRCRSVVAELQAGDRALHWRRLVGGFVFAAFSTVVSYALFIRLLSRTTGGSFTPGDVAMFGGAVLRLGSMLEDTTLAISGSMEEVLHISALRAFFGLKPSASTGNRPVPAALRGEIELRNVSFTYPGVREPALSDISLRIRPGETVAFAGENGAGKTTLVKVIARLYDPDQGQILLDGIDLREFDLPALHRAIAFVLQGSGRYEATVAENIAYGDWRRLIGDRAHLKQAARLADVDDMIEALPQGYETLVGRMFGQYDLSAGQWQRIALARAFVRDAALLILDEPSSSLDARAEYQLVSRFRELASGRTTILISHQLSTVSLADRIIVLDRGRVVEEGTHQELLALTGHYATLYDLYQRQQRRRELPGRGEIADPTR
jgi:ATP-binding cassette subfamily B protein